MYPDAQIDVLALEGSRELLENHPSVNRFFGLKKRDGLPMVRKLWELRKEKYDLVLAFHANTSLCRWLFLAGGKEKIAHHHSWKKTPACSDRKLGRPGVLLDAIARDYEILRALGWTGKALPTSLKVEDADALRMEARLKSLGLPGTQRRLALLPGASEELKRYPLELWEKVVNDLRKEGRFEIAMICDAELSQRWNLKAWSERMRIPLIDDLKLKNLTAMLSRFQLSVSNDSGPGHIAVALGLRSVHIFGRGCLGDFHPYDLNLHQYLRVVVDCRASGPKDLEKFRFCTVKECSHLSCLRKIAPEDVVRATLAVDSARV